MDVKQLRYFLGVVEAGSLTKASGPLHVAQTALGTQIRNLEKELGDPPPLQWSDLRYVF